MELKLNYKEKFILFLKWCMQSAAFLLIGVITIILCFLAAKGLALFINKAFGIGETELINFSGSILAGILGVAGGIIVARLQVNWNRTTKVLQLKNYIKTSILAEVKLNNQHFINYFDRNDINVDSNVLFKLSDWESVKYETYLLSNEQNFDVAIKDLCELYVWLERANHLIAIKLNVNDSTMANLKRKIKECLLDCEEKIKKL